MDQTVFLLSMRGRRLRRRLGRLGITLGLVKSFVRRREEEIGYGGICTKKEDDVRCSSSATKGGLIETA